MYNYYAIAHAYNATNTHAQGNEQAGWNQKVTLSLKAIGLESIQGTVVVYWKQQAHHFDVSHVLFKGENKEWLTTDYFLHKVAPGSPDLPWNQGPLSINKRLICLLK